MAQKKTADVISIVERRRFQSTEHMTADRELSSQTAGAEEIDVSNVDKLIEILNTMKELPGYFLRVLHLLLEELSRSQPPELVARFRKLKNEWETDTAAYSSLTEIAMHPAYQQIIGMGQVAIPLIMDEIRRKPGHWFWALKSITGEDPVPPEKRGRIKDMTKAWLQWWEDRKYLR
jgi:hypothetical protein